jgi:hypothetical protein
LTTALTSFVGAVTTDSKTLNGFADLAKTAVGADDAAVAKMQGVIELFQKSIENQNHIMTLEKMLTWDLNMFLVMAGTSVGLIFGPAGVFWGTVAGTVFSAVTATITTFVPIGVGEVVDADQLKAEQAAVTYMNNEVGQLNSQIAVVQATAKSFAAVVATGSAVSAAVTTVGNVWTTLRSALTTAFDSTTAAQQALGASNFRLAGEKKAAAMAAWGNVQKWCEALQGLKISINPQTVTAQLPRKPN